MVHDEKADKVVEEVAKVRKFAKKISWNALDNWSWVLGSHIVGGYGDWQGGRQDGGGWQDVWGGGAGWKNLGEGGRQICQISLRANVIWASDT